MTDDKPVAFQSRELVKEIAGLSGMEAIDNILNRANPAHLIQNMTRVDLLWLIKKIGEDDSLPILSLASNEQWQYLIDMEVWERDRIDLEKTFNWVSRFHRADAERLSEWLYGDGNLMAHYYFFRNLQVEIKRDDDHSIPEGFFSLDNLYYIRILDKRNEEIIEGILRQLAQKDYDRYQALLMGLLGTIPSEVEEEMYRLRGVRLAEDGYLPFEEAISIYAYQKADLLKTGESIYKLHLPSDDETRALVPITPFIHAGGNNLLAESVRKITDNALLDRLRLEFAGLCNQVLSADGIRVDGLDILTGTCRKVAGYISVGLEKLSDNNISLSEHFLKSHPLISIFQAGFGITLELKWEVERWAKEAWYLNKGLNAYFWGDEWGGTLLGILKKRPLLFTGLQEDREYREFERLSEVENCKIVMHRIIGLDRLLGILYSAYPLEQEETKDPLLTFHPFLFNYWANLQLKLDPGFAVLSLEQAKDLFGLLRAGDQHTPFQMLGFEKIFIEDFMSYASEFEPDSAHQLSEILSILWQQFVEEYAGVAINDLDARFSKFILIESDS